MLNQMMKQNSADTIPLQIGNYKIVSQIGRGGMGDIYKAVQEPLNRIVALKVLPPKLSRDVEFAKRFEIEARAISLLQHHNIVSIYEYGEEQGLRYFAMQFVDGTDLGRRIGEHRPIPIAEILDYTRQIGRALRYAHSCSIIHRDIKHLGSDYCRLENISNRRHPSGRYIRVIGQNCGLTLSALYRDRGIID